MTKELGLTDDLSFLLGKNISGHIQFNTDEGPVRIIFRSANIVLPKKEDGFQNITGEKINEILSQKYLSSQKKLDEYILNLPDPDRKKYPLESGRWQNRWDSDVLDYGNDALISLFPRDINKFTGGIIRILNRLIYKPGTKIRTKTELIKTPLDEIDAIYYVGEKSLELIRLMKGMAIAERNLQNKP